MVLCCHEFLVQGDREGLELLEVVGTPSNQVSFNLVLEAIVEGGGDYYVAVELGFKDELLELFRVLAHRTGLLHAGEETLPCLFLSVHVVPFEAEVLLERAPLEEVFRGIVPVRQFPLDALPVGGLVGAHLERPLDFDAVGRELSTVQVDVVVAFREECPGFGTGTVERGWEYHLGSAPLRDSGA